MAEGLHLTHDNHNIIAQFNRTFNQLAAQLIIRWPERVHLLSPYTKYPAFLHLLDELKKKYDKFHFHTLNHDLLLEELALSSAMSDGFADGFEYIGSPFYSINTKMQHLRLRYFTNKFDQKFCLYKLHGSLDQYLFNFKNEEYSAVKITAGCDRKNLYKEFKDSKGKWQIENYWWNYAPDFLSGTTEKTYSYDDAHYYKPVFDHFKQNLTQSELLIAIGYGMADHKINELISKIFLSDPEKRMLIISPTKPDSALFEHPNVKYYGVGLGVEHLDINLIQKQLNLP